jgi:ABC-type multidrug transport system ATPase subunit
MRCTFACAGQRENGCRHLRTLITLQAESLAKHFGGPLLFENLSFETKTGESLALTGPNGSGKSTLLQILWGHQRPTAGRADLLVDGKAVEREERPFITSFSAPYLGMPEYMTGRALLDFHFAKRRATLPLDVIWEETGLSAVADKAVRTYSSGQRQRLRLALALYTDAKAFFLDEPCTNLDDVGIELYLRHIERRREDSLIVIASNWEVEMAFADRRIAIAAP